MVLNHYGDGLFENHGGYNFLRGCLWIFWGYLENTRDYSKKLRDSLAKVEVTSKLTEVTAEVDQVLKMLTVT
jgi:hypothetical protein